MKLSSSNFPTFTFSHRLWNRLSKRTFTDSKWKAPVSSAEGTSRKEKLFSRVPPVRISSPLRLKPEVVIRCSPVAAVSIATLFVLSRLQNGVMRRVIGQYDGFCQIGASRSFII